MKQLKMKRINLKMILTGYLICSMAILAINCNDNARKNGGNSTTSSTGTRVGPTGGNQSTGSTGGTGSTMGTSNPRGSDSTWTTSGTGSKSSSK